MPQEERVGSSPVDNSRGTSGIPPTVTRVTPAPPRLSSQRVVCAGVLVVAAMLTACSPTPIPTPTPTPLFASEDEAFAAAEAIFARYVDALNNIDTSRPETFEELFELSSGSVEEADRRNFSSMHAKGQIVEGDTRVLSFEGVQTAAPYSAVTAAVCLDVSRTSIYNADGTSAVTPGRPEVYPLKVTFRAAPAGPLLIDSAATSEGFTCPAS